MEWARTTGTKFEDRRMETQKTQLDRSTGVRLCISTFYANWP